MKHLLLLCFVDFLLLVRHNNYIKPKGGGGKEGLRERGKERERGERREERRERKTHQEGAGEISSSWDTEILCAYENCD